MPEFRRGVPLLLMRAAFVAAGLTLGVADALGFCFRPDAPYCASRYGGFDEEYDFSRCRREMESYRSDVEDFLDCLKREVRRPETERRGSY
jgi:hypothetical protein